MKLGQVALTVDDLPRTVGFYRDVLRLPLLFEFPNLAFFDLGGARLMLSAAQPEGERHESVLYYQVDDLTTEFEAIVSRGAKVERVPQMTAKMPDHELWIGFVRDTENRLVGIMSEVRS